MMKKYPKKSRQSIEEVPKDAEDMKGKNTPLKGGTWTKKTKVEVGLNCVN